MLLSEMFHSSYGLLKLEKRNLLFVELVAPRSFPVPVQIHSAGALSHGFALSPSPDRCL